MVVMSWIINTRLKFIHYYIIIIIIISIDIHYIIDIRSIILSCQFINFYSKIDDKFNIFLI